MNDGQPASRPPDLPARSAAAAFAAFFQREQSAAREPAAPRSRVWPIAALIGVVLIVVSLVGGQLLGKKTQAASTAPAKASASAR